MRRRAGAASRSISTPASSAAPAPSVALRTPSSSPGRARRGKSTGCAAAPAMPASRFARRSAWTWTSATRCPRSPRTRTSSRRLPGRLNPSLRQHLPPLPSALYGDPATHETHQSEIVANKALHCRCLDLCVEPVISQASTRKVRNGLQSFPSKSWMNII